MNDPARQRVAGFTLIDADRDLPLDRLSEGMTIRLAALPTRHLNVRADTWPATVGARMRSRQRRTRGRAPPAQRASA